jgi:hypothetical protein
LNFLDTFVDWTKDSESPESFFLWSGLSAISAVMRDNIYQQWQYDRLYPNMFVLLIAPPAIGKRLPMVMAGKLIKRAKNTKVIEGSASIQAVVKSLGSYETGGQKGASCILYSEEFSSFHVKDQNTNELLTDLWDYHEVWERNLISWQATLKNVCMSLLAASNEVLLKEILDSRAMFGGLLSRTILVMEKRKRRRDALIRKGDLAVAEHGKLMEGILGDHLVNLSKIKGPIEFDEEALKEFEFWYDTEWKDNEENPKTTTGIEGRMKTHVKKVAMAIAMCEGNLDLWVRKIHVEFAIELCLRLYRNYQILSSESGKSPTAHPAAILIRMLSGQKDYTLSRKSILRMKLGEFNPTILDEVVLTLQGAELLVEVSEGNEVSYRLTTKCLEMYQILKQNKAVR